MFGYSKTIRSDKICNIEAVRSRKTVRTIQRDSDIFNRGSSISSLRSVNDSLGYRANTQLNIQRDRMDHTNCHLNQSMDYTNNNLLNQQCNRLEGNGIDSNCKRTKHNFRSLAHRKNKITNSVDYNNYSITQTQFEMSGFNNNNSYLLTHNNPLLTNKEIQRKKEAYNRLVALYDINERSKLFNERQIKTKLNNRDVLIKKASMSLIKARIDNKDILAKRMEHFNSIFDKILMKKKEQNHSKKANNDSMANTLDPRIEIKDYYEMNDKFINQRASALKDNSMDYIYFKDIQTIKNDLFVNKIKNKEKKKQITKEKPMFKI